MTRLLSPPVSKSWEPLTLLVTVAVTMGCLHSANTWAQSSPRSRPAVSADRATLQIVCEGKNAGAEITVQGEVKGDCPLDVQIAPGTIRILATKQASDTTELASEQEIRIGSGTTKRIEIELGPPRLNARGRTLNKGKEQERAQSDRTDSIEANRLRAAAEAGDTGAMLALSLAFRAGKGLPINEEQASIWERKAAEGGNAKAMAQLGQLAEKKRNFAEAFVWYEKLANKGDPAGEGNLAALYFNGTGVVKDVDKGVALWRKAAGAGSTRAMNGLGVAYLNGLGTPKDVPQALQWFRRASDAGEARAHTVLASLHLRGGEGISQDPASVVRLCQLAIDGGNLDCYGLLADLHFFGLGVAKDEAKGLSFVRAGAEAGNPNSMRMLGAYHFNGNAGLPANSPLALTWLRKAAALGDEPAIKEVETMRLRGHTQDAAEAAAQQNAAPSADQRVVTHAPVQQPPPPPSPSPGFGGGLFGGLLGGVASQIVDRNAALVNSALGGSGVAGRLAADMNSQLAAETKEQIARQTGSTDEGRMGNALASALTSGGRAGTLASSGVGGSGTTLASQTSPGTASGAQSGANNAALLACKSVSYPGSKADPQTYVYDAIAQFDACAYKSTGDSRYVTDGNNQCKALAGLLASTRSAFRPYFCSGSLMKQ